MNQRLAVESERARLQAACPESIRILNIIEDTVYDREAVGTRGRDTDAEGSGQVLTIRRMPAAEFLDEVVRAHHKTSKPAAGGSNFARIQNRQRRLHRSE